MIKKWMTVLAAAAIAVCCAGCSQVTGTAGEPPDQTETVQQNGLAVPSENTLTVVVKPQDNLTLNYCLQAVMNGQMGLHNNSELMALVTAQENQTTASYTTWGNMNGISVQCHVVYDGTQYTLTLSMELYGTVNEMKAHYQTLLQMPNPDGATGTVYLTDCTDEMSMMPSVGIGTYWTQEVIEQVDRLQNGDEEALNKQNEEADR